MHADSASPTCTASDTVLDAAATFVLELNQLDRRARRDARTLPTQHELSAVRTLFWDGLIEAIADAERTLASGARDLLADEVRSMLAPWLLRSRYWNRSLVKPHGYPGDYRMLEMMYDLETASMADPCSPAVANVLDD